MNYQRISDDGRYGLAREDDGYYMLYMIDHTGEVGDQPVGAVADPENFDYAVDVAEEEMRCLVADAMIEFGVTP